MKYQIISDCTNSTLAADIIDDKERLILKKGAIITEVIVERLKNFGIVALPVEDPLTDDIDVTKPVSDKTIVEACNAINTEEEYTIDVDAAFIAAGKLVNELCDNISALGNGLHIFKAYDENTALHSVNVAILSITLGIHLGLPVTRLNNLGIGGMLHDIGKANIPPEILHKAGPLDEEERKIINTHPQAGYDILDKDILMPAPVKAIVLQHHENWDGSGYPRGLSEHKVFDLAAIVHICDVFDALISKRSYKESFSYYDTIEYMKSQSGKMFSPYYLKYFFRFVPIFHTGTIVILNTNEEAFVVKNNPGDMTKPWVRICSNGRDINLLDHNDIWIIS